MIRNRSLPSRRDNAWYDWPKERRNTLAYSLAASVGFLIVGLYPVSIVLTGIGVVLILPVPGGNKFVIRWLRERRANKKVRKAYGNVYSVKLEDYLFDGESADMKQEDNHPAVEINAIPIEGGKGGLLGEVHASYSGMQTMYMNIDGDPAAATPGTDAAYYRNDALVQVANRLGEVFGPKIEVTYIMRKRPADPYPTMRYLTDNMRDPRESDQVAGLVSNLRTATQAVYDPSTVDIQTVIAVSGPRPRGWNKTSLDELPRAEFERSVAFSATDTLSQELGIRGYKGVSRANMFDVNGLLRTEFDTVRSDAFYADKAEDQSNAKNIKAPRDSLVLRSGPFPKDWRVGSNYLRVGDTWHRTLRANFTLQEAPDGFYRTLFGLEDGWYTIAITTKVTSAKLESKKRQQRRRDADVRRAQRTKEGSTLTPQQEDEENQIIEEERALYFGRAVPIRTSLLVRLSAPTKTELEAATSHWEATGRGLHLPFSIVSGESLQVPAALRTVGIISDKIQ